MIDNLSPAATAATTTTVPACLAFSVHIGHIMPIALPNKVIQ